MNFKYKDLIKSASEKCELCGDCRNLEVHHIVPRCVGGSDDVNNLIVICGTCHARLTPKSELTKVGLKRVKRQPHVVLNNAINKFYRLVSDEGLHTVNDIMDAFEETIVRQQDYYCRLAEKGDI